MLKPGLYTDDLGDEVVWLLEANIEVAWVPVLPTASEETESGYSVGEFLARWPNRITGVELPETLEPLSTVEPGLYTNGSSVVQVIEVFHGYAEYYYCYRPNPRDDHWCRSEQEFLQRWPYRVDGVVFR